jgi:hypothetical protein
MKSFKTALAVITAALVALALFATPTSGISPVTADPTGDDDNANLELRPPGGTYDSGTVIEILANFQNSTAGQKVTLWRENAPGSNVYEVAEVDTSANSSGNAYFHPTIGDGARKYFAEDASLRQTEAVPITGTPTPQSTTATLDPSTNGKNWTAHFGEPAVPGKATHLQIQRIYTDEVSDVDAVNPTASKRDKMGEWKTIASSTQDADGDSSFTLASPYPYRVAHKYRAVSGTAKSCEPTTARDTTPPLCQTFGLDQTTPKPTGLSAVYFNTNEGHAVDTRSRYFEGEFSMTADTKGLGCTAVPKMKFSTMKGRGNYSWSFKRKSYTLKLGDSTSLCGMGASKKYALVSQDYDKSFLRNALAQYVGKKFMRTPEWVPDSKPVDLYLNGKYLGNYLLVERIAIAADRVAINELNGNDPAENTEPGVTGGYILEWDFRAADGGSSAPDRYMNIGTRGLLGIKEPEDDRDREGANTGKGISTTQKNYITNYVDDCDTKLFSSNFTSDGAGGWKSCIDEASAVDYYLAMEYMKPVDGNMWASVYMYKPQNGKLHLGPLWDFDLAAGSATRSGNVASPSSWYLRNNLGVSAQQSSKTWFNRLNEDPDFRAATKARWNEVQGSLAPSLFLNEQKNAIQTSANTSFSSAPNGASHSYRISSYQVIKGSSWISDFDHLKWWASSRKDWINSQF